MSKAHRADTAKVGEIWVNKYRRMTGVERVVMITNINYNSVSCYEIMYPEYTYYWSKSDFYETYILLQGVDREQQLMSNK